MKLISIAALAVALTAIALPAQAAWQSETEDSAGYYTAWVYDTNDEVQLSVDCDTFWMEHSIALVSDEAWKGEEAYPKTVQVAIAVDGRALGETQFVVENASGNVGLAAYEMDAPEVFDLIGKMGLAERDIEVSFLDQQLHFPADKIFESTLGVKLACLQ